MIELIAITALALYGTKVTWQEGMIFEQPKLWLDSVFQVPYEEAEKPTAWQRTMYYLSKPLYACPACMVSIWGTLIYHFSVSSTWSIPSYITFLFSTCGLTWIFLTQFPFDD